MKKSTKLPIIYLLGMPILFIVANFFARTHFDVAGSPFYFSVILYPLTYLISGLIVKKTDYKTSLLMMGITLVIASLTYVLQWAMLDFIDAYVMIYSFLSFLICQIIFIYTYDFLRKIGRDTYGWVFILVLIVSAIDNAFFGAVIEGQTISLSMLIRLLYVVGIPVGLAKKNEKKK